MANLPSGTETSTETGTLCGIRPMPVWQAILYFGIPALIFRVALYWGIPFFLAHGIAPYPAYLLGNLIPFALLLLATLVAYRSEGRSFTWGAFSERMRLRAVPGRAWLWVVGGLIVIFVADILLMPTATAIQSIPLFAPPSGLATAPTHGQFMGIAIVGNWSIIIAEVLLLLINVFAEELWWRGYILPRQEREHGQLGWLANGILWDLFHVVFYPWAIVAELPIWLIIPFIAQRFKNTWPGIVMHFLINASGSVILLLAVLGVAQ